MLCLYVWFLDDEVYFSSCSSQINTQNIHTYIHNWPLQPFSQDYGLDSHTIHVVCVNFIPEWRDLQLNVDSERQIFEKLFHGRFIYSQSFCQKSAERKLPKKYFSYLIFDGWPGIRTQAFASNKPTTTTSNCWIFSQTSFFIWKYNPSG